MRQDLITHGEFPSTHIFKAFSKIGHAEEFIEKGLFRMGSLKSYRETEDSRRRDKTEGFSHTREPGQVIQVYFDRNCLDNFKVTEESGYIDIHSALGNPVYILSTSLPEVNINYLKNKFGPFIVQINNPIQLAHDITKHLKNRIEKYAGGVEAAPVSYTKSKQVNTRSDNFRLSTLSYTQKPSCFSPEHEFRFIIINMDKPSKRITHPYLEIDLKTPISHAKIINV